MSEFWQLQSQYLWKYHIGKGWSTLWINRKKLPPVKQNKWQLLLGLKYRRGRSSVHITNNAEFFVELCTVCCMMGKNHLPFLHKHKKATFLRVGVNPFSWGKNPLELKPLLSVISHLTYVFVNSFQWERNSTRPSFFFYWREMIRKRKERWREERRGQKGGEERLAGMAENALCSSYYCSSSKALVTYYSP